MAASAPPPMEVGKDVDPTPKRIKNRGLITKSFRTLFHDALYFPLKLPEDRVLQSSDRAHHQQLICFAVSFWFLIITAAALFLGVWFIGYSGAHLSSTEQRASFQVVGLYPDGQPINPNQLAYCTQSGASAYPNGFSQTCHIGSASEIVYPDASGGNIFVVTRVTLREEVRLCPVAGDVCTTPVWTNLTAENISFWAAPESMTVRVSHAIVVNHHQWSSLDLYGDMVDQQGNVIAEFDKKTNNIPLSTFLRAAGLDLDAPGDNNPTFPYRYWGVILNVVVEYHNWKKFGTPIHSPKYRYRVYHMPRTEYRIITPSTVAANDTNRILEHRRGVSLQFSSTGKYYEYNSFNIFLVILSTFFILGDILVIWQCFISTLYQVEEVAYEV